MNITNYNLDTNTDNTIVFETSLVSDPATGYSWLAFKNHSKIDSKALSKEFKLRVLDLEFNSVEGKPDALNPILKDSSVSNTKMRMLSGLWFQPNQPIYRIDEDGTEYTTSITAEDLKLLLLKHLKSNSHQNYLLEHEGDFLDQVVDIETWIYNSPESRSPIFNLSPQDLGYESVEIGSVFKTVYIRDEQFWEDYILSGKVTGFSIGGLFNLTNNPNLNNFNDMRKKQFNSDTVEELEKKLEEVKVETKTALEDENFNEIVVEEEAIKEERVETETIPSDETKEDTIENKESEEINKQDESLKSLDEVKSKIDSLESKFDKLTELLDKILSNTETKEEALTDTIEVQSEIIEELQTFKSKALASLKKKPIQSNEKVTTPAITSNTITQTPKKESRVRYF